MATTSGLYGVIAILLAALLIMSSAGLYFYFDYAQAQKANGTYLGELGQVRASYNSTAGKYNELLSNYNGLRAGYNMSVSDLSRMVSLYNDTISEFNSLSSTYETLSARYNATLSLLASSVSVLNTTEPAYLNASRSLTSLWKDYESLTASYRGELALFDSSYSSFKSLLQDYQTLSGAKLTLAEPASPIRLPVFTSDFLLDFGNGTYRWYNGTSVQPGWNSYIETLVITGGNIEAQWYPAYGEHYVTGIDGVSNSQTRFWFLWAYNSTTRWQVASEGADLLPAYNGSLFAWTYCAAPPPSYTPACKPR